MKICIEFVIFSIYKKYFRYFQLLASKEVEELKQKVIELETANAGKLKDWRKIEMEQTIWNCSTYLPKWTNRWRIRTTGWSSQDFHRKPTLWVSNFPTQIIKDRNLVWKIDPDLFSRKSAMTVSF